MASKLRALLIAAFAIGLSPSAAAAPDAAGAAPDAAVATTADDSDGVSGKDRYYDAVNRAQAGGARQALAEFLALAAELPADEFADDALMEAARLSEQELKDPEGALALYQRVLAEYAGSRVARRARARADYLTQNLVGGSAVPLAELMSLLQGFATDPPGSVRRAEALLQAHPDFASADHATYFLAHAYASGGRTREALTLFHRITERWPGSSWAPFAWQEIGNIHLGARRWSDARAAYEKLGNYGTDALAEGRRSSLEKLAKERLKWDLYRIALVLIALFLLAHAALIAVPKGREKPPQLLPIELLFYLPLGGLFGLAALTVNHDIRAATLLIALGGAVIIWLTANTLRCRPPTRKSWLWRAGLHGLAVALVALSMGYASIHVTGLTDFVWETVITGAERH